MVHIKRRMFKKPTSVCYAQFSPGKAEQPIQSQQKAVSNHHSYPAFPIGFVPTYPPLFSPTGKGGICFSSNFYCRVRDEDHSVRVVATPDRVPPECLEPVRFYNCHDRVSDVAVVFAREHASEQCCTGCDVNNVVEVEG